MELAGSAEGLLAAERHLSLLFGRQPTLFELVDELLERHHCAETPEEPAVEAWTGT